MILNSPLKGREEDGRETIHFDVPAWIVFFIIMT
jgi:hypothetical protein